MLSGKEQRLFPIYLWFGKLRKGDVGSFVSQPLGSKRAPIASVLQKHSASSENIANRFGALNKHSVGRNIVSNSWAPKGTSSHAVAKTQVQEPLSTLRLLIYRFTVLPGRTVEPFYVLPLFRFHSGIYGEDPLTPSLPPNQHRECRDSNLWSGVAHLVVVSKVLHEGKCALSRRNTAGGFWHVFSLLALLFPCIFPQAENSCCMLRVRKAQKRPKLSESKPSAS